MSLFGAVAASYVASAPVPFATVAAALSPTAWYRLGDSVGSSTFADSSGNSHGGTLSQGVTFGTTGLVTGDSDTAATIASPSNAQVAAGAWLDAAPTAVSMFVIAKTSQSTGTPMLLSRDDFSARQWQWRLNAGKMEFVKIAGSVVTASAPTSTADGNIHDYGVTYDGSNIRLYVDGAKVTTQAAAGSLGTLGSRLFLALRAPTGTATDFYVGVLDEILYKVGTVWADSDFAALHAAR